MEGSHLRVMFTPILWLAHFTEKNMGILQHVSGFLTGSNQKANILTSWADPARCIWWRAFRSRHQHVRGAVFTSQAPKPAHTWRDWQWVRSVEMGSNMLPRYIRNPRHLSLETIHQSRHTVFLPFTLTLSVLHYYNMFITTRIHLSWF